MINKVIICGDVNAPCKIDLQKQITIREILEEYAGGIKNGNSVKLVQIGGALGDFVMQSELESSISEYSELVETPMVMYFGDVFCPVDYLRFLTRYTIRELGVDTPLMRKLNQQIEMIAQGQSDGIDALKRELNRSENHVTVTRVIEIFGYMINAFEIEIIEHIEQKKCRNGICRGLFVSQCINACPAGVHIPGYIELMKSDDMENAYHLMRQSNPLSLVCGKVCARPCEDRCRRGEIESTVGVRALKHYTADMVLRMNDFKEEKMDCNGKLVGVIGAGPTGLTAAYYLARTGYDVTIYDANAVVGGMLATGIPEFRLAQAAIDKEVRLIEQLGVKIKLNTKVGEDISFSEIEKNNDAVLLATGLQKGIKLGEDSNQIDAAVDFLKDVKVSKRETVGQSVVIIGGGDVAFDAARTAARLGAKEVTIVSLEKKNALPASKEEIEDALNEKVKMINGFGVHQFMKDGDRIIGVDLKACMKMIDCQDRFNPVYDEGNRIELKADHIIYAIGQRADHSYLEDAVEVKQNQLTTTKEKVFAAGDMIEAGIAVKAIAEGKKAAELIDAYLNGSGIYTGPVVEIPERPLNSTSWSIEKSDEQKNGSLNFDEVRMVYDIDSARKEADRCMRCDRNSIKPLFLRA